MLEIPILEFIIMEIINNKHDSWTKKYYRE